MTLNLKDVIAKVRDAITTNKEWVAEKESVLQQLQDAETKLNDYKESAVTADQMKSTYETQINELKDSHNKGIQALNDQIKTLQDAIEAEKNSAEVKAQAIASSMGITSEDKLPKVTNVLSLEDQLNKAVSPKEKLEIFNKNKKELMELAAKSATPK